MTIQRGYVAGNFGLEMDGKPSGWLYSAEGGMPNTEVVMEKLGPDHELHKHISGLKYEDLTITFGTGMSSNFWKWIQASFDRDYTRKNGAIVAADYNYKETSRLSFYQALCSELTFPGLDASSKDPCRVTCKVTPEYTKMQLTPKGSKQDYVSDNKDQNKQHRWSPANFRLNIDGTDCSRVFKVEPITLRQKIIDFQVGEDRMLQKEPVQIEYPNLAITLPESHSHEFFDWYNDFVVDGNCSEDKERTATLEYLNPSLDKVLFTLHFDRLGIFKVSPDKYEGGSETIRRVKFEMYCESIKFEYSQDAVFG
jgi:phage tail-like protein